MFKSDWDVLGIERTADLPSIKKAYASRLRVTRPDDDADAYQLLRAAYERVQQWARSARHEEEPPPQAVPEPDVVVAREPAREFGHVEEPAEPTELPTLPPSAAAPEPIIGSAELAAWVERLVPERPAHRANLDAAWSEIRLCLLSVPLHLQAEASARFADLVIRQASLPVDIVEALQKHFGWLDDFRAARMLGPERLHALHETLEERIVRPITNPDVLNHFAPLIHMQRLSEQGRRWRATWFAARMGSPLAELSKALDPRSRKRLGLDTDVRLAIQSALTWASTARIAALGLLVALMLLPRLISDHRASWAILVVGPFLASLALYVLTLMAAFICGLSRIHLKVSARAEQRWHRIREHWGCATLGLGLLAGIALYNSLASDSMPIEFSALPWLIGLLLAWPRHPLYSIVVLAGMLIVALVLILPPFQSYDEVTLLCWVPVWVLGGLLIHLRGGEIPVLPMLFRPVTNSLRLCDRYGYKMALAPMIVAAAAPLAIEGIRGTSVFVIWALSILGLFALQDRLTTAAMNGIDTR